MANIIYKNTQQYIASEVRFYTIDDLVKLTSWSYKIVEKMFNDPLFPALNYGKKKVVEAHALIEYCSTRRDKESEPYWKR